MQPETTGRSWNTEYFYDVSFLGEFLLVVLQTVYRHIDSKLSWQEQFLQSCTVTWFVITAKVRFHCCNKYEVLSFFTDLVNGYVEC